MNKTTTTLSHSKFLEKFGYQSESKHLQNKVQYNYGKWIESLDWDFYCTFTTGYELTLKSSRRLMEHTHRILVRDSNSPIRFFWVAEPFDSKEGFHTHGLIYFENRLLQETKFDKQTLDFQFLRNSFKKASGKNQNYNLDGINGIRSKFLRYQKDKGAHYYLGKYVFKKACDFDILT